MSAPAAAGVDGRRSASEARVSGAPPHDPRSAAAPRGGDRHAAGTRSGRVRLPALDRADPRLARGRRRPRDRDHVLAPARDHVAGQRAPHRQRCRLRPARAGHRARRLVEHERLVDLRRHVRGGAAVEVRRPGPRQPRLQPVELRPRPLLPAARRATRRPTRALVGPALPRARRGARPDRRRRVPHPPAAAPRCRSRSASGSRSPRGSACSRRAGTR